MMGLVRSENMFQELCWRNEECKCCGRLEWALDHYSIITSQVDTHISLSHSFLPALSEKVNFIK